LGEEERVTLTDRHVEIWKAHSKQADLTIQNCMVIESAKASRYCTIEQQRRNKGQKIGDEKVLEERGGLRGRKNLQKSGKRKKKGSKELYI